MAKGCAAKNYNIEMYEEHITEYFASQRSLRRQMKEKATSSLGRTIGSVAKRIEPFDPYAKDGDSDNKLQDGSIHERPVSKVKLATPSGSYSRISDSLIDQSMSGDEIEPEQAEYAELIDSAILEQIEVALGYRNPKDVEATKTITESFETPFGAKTPSSTFIIKKAIEKYNIDYGTDFSLENLIADLIEEVPEYSEFDVKIKGHFLLLDKSKRKISLIQHRSRNYKYGDKSVMGGEIRANRSDWLDNLTPEQIASLVVPDNEDDAFEIYLDMTYGNSADLIRGDDQVLEKAKLIFGLYTKNISFSTVIDEDGNEKLLSTKPASSGRTDDVRASLERMLMDRPEFLEAVRKLGMPPVLVFDIDDEGDQKIKNNLSTIGAWYNYNSSFIAFPTNSLDSLNKNSITYESIQGKIGRGEPISVLDELRAVATVTLEKGIAHEWGHYLHHMIRRSYKRENGVTNQSLIGINKSGYEKYNKVIEKLKEIGLNLTSESRINPKNGIGLRIDDDQLISEIEKNRNAIMVSAKEFADQIFDITEKLVSGQISRSEARSLINEVMSSAKRGGIIAAPTMYGASSPHEQFAELISFFFSGPLSRRVMSPESVSFLTNALSTILPIGFSKIDRSIIKAEE